MIPPVVASDRGRAQTHAVATRLGGCRTTPLHGSCEGNPLESGAAGGDSPVPEAFVGIVVS